MFPTIRTVPSIVRSYLAHRSNRYLYNSNRRWTTLASPRCATKLQDYLYSNSSSFVHLRNYQRIFHQIPSCSLTSSTNKNIDTPSPWNIANAITMGRIVIAPCIGYWIIEEKYQQALAGLIYAGASDFVDGFVARRLNLKTVVGSFLDPAADKLLISTTTICLSYHDIIPTWLVGLILGRDLFLVGGWISLQTNNAKALFSRAQGNVVQFKALDPILISKVNTALQIVLSFSGVIYGTDWGIIHQDTLNILEMTTAVTTMASGISYSRLYFKLRNS